MSSIAELSPVQIEAVAEIVEYISEYGHTSFAEMIRIIESHGVNREGDMCLSLPEYQNIVLWAGLSDEAADILDAVMMTPGMVRKPSSQLVYLIDGALLRMPLAKRIHAYKKPHWLPITLSLEVSA